MITLNIDNKQLVVSDIVTDSRKVVPNSVFIAYKGFKIDAHDFIPQAIEKGASYIIGEYPYSKIKNKLKGLSRDRYIQVADGRKAWAVLEAQKYGNPQKKLKIIGVTGTDGKTTTVHFIYYILKAAGRKVGLSSTTKALFGKKEVDTGAHVTTPPPNVLFKFLDNMVKSGLEYAVLEITSHSLVQDRVYGINLEVAGVTNVTHEHFDIHKTYINVLKAKSKIFKMTKNVVLIPSAPGITDIMHYLPRNINVHLVQDIYKCLDTKKLTKKFFARFPGEYNLYNACLAASMARVIGIEDKYIYAGLNSAKPPEGRFQFIKNKLGINLYVDFAHTPNAIKDLLIAVRNLRKKGQKIIVVFGAAGERDHTKRHLMGKFASELADEVILTLEDPRSEDPYDIVQDIISDVKDYPFIISIDRNKAIELAIQLARPGDWVLMLGKGHETSMNIGGIEYPWSDIDVTRKSAQKVYKVRSKQVHNIP